jgi:DNA-binding transcriptional LysR family regulator
VQLEVAETATLVAFVAAGIGVSLVPAAVANLAINGAVYRPLADTDITVELALAWRRDDTSAVVGRALELIREPRSKLIREHMAALGH